jgi:hypothetical protein
MAISTQTENGKPMNAAATATATASGKPREPIHLGDWRLKLRRWCYVLL